MIDTKVGGVGHDVRRPHVGGRILDRVRRGDYDLVFAAPPCESFSVRHRPQLRSRKQPGGLQNAPPEWRAYLQKHNELATWTTELARTAHRAGALWAVENPADRGDRASNAHWRGMEDHAPLWVQRCVEQLAAHASPAKRTFAYCAFGADHQKYTTVMHDHDWFELAQLDERQCEHGREQHAEQLSGRLPSGESRAGRAAAYPDELNHFLATQAAAALRRRLVGRTDAAGEGGRRASAASSDRPAGGRVGEGWNLSALVAGECEAARRTAPRFASARNKQPMLVSDLRHHALPGDLHAPPARTRPGGMAASRRPRPPEAAARHAAAKAAERDEAERLRAARLEAGPVNIRELFLADVYDQLVMPWFDLVDQAVAELRSGRKPPSVPTVTINQDQMAPFARGVVWDCGNPDRCAPVTRSDRHTTFPGQRQVDRAALRKVAAAIGWERVDPDIIQQIGEGGVEARTGCALTTVLAWHHTGVVANLEAATKVIEKDIDEGWAARPVRHLPFVPCRILPRNVVMQERARVLPGSTPDGRPLVEMYDKPRITQNSSHGGEDSVNAGVDDDEAFVLLPSVQRLALGWAVCDTAGEVGGARAEAYVVDAESAFRFCPLQTEDLWTQCFIWWGPHPPWCFAGVCVDRRLGFGGAYSPNRFERISTMCAAYAQYLQAQFDAAHPPPPCARRWTAARESRRASGALPDASAQTSPRYLQVFIDDFTGVALNDAVPTPPEVSHIVIDPRTSTSAGAAPAQPGTRVYVHAQLTVLAIQTVGLSAAPGKVVAGNPVIALGFSAERGEELGSGALRCTELKRQAMRHAGAEARALALAGSVQRQPAERLVGRLCNVSQALPEIKCHLGGGYAVIRATWEVGGVRRRPPRLQLRPGGGVQREWVELLDIAEDVLEANEGVAFAPQPCFPGREEPGAVTVITDASGVDGVGGYALDPARPHEAWLVSEVWPRDIQLALDRAARPRAERERAVDAAEGRLSMPAAETFGQWAVAEAFAEARNTRPSAITAIGDCDPAAAAINAAASGKAQIRRLLRDSRELCTQWLGVSVSRDLNLDADRLSHPALLEEVRQDARAAGMETHVVPIPTRCWESLRAAIAAEAQDRRAARKRRAS